MLNATISNDTRELMSFAGALHDLINLYIAWYERVYPAICGEYGIPGCELDRVCEAFRPAITFFEEDVRDRVYEFMSGDFERL